MQLLAGLYVSIGLAITLWSKFTVHYAGLGILVSCNDVDIKVWGYLKEYSRVVDVAWRWLDLQAWGSLRSVSIWSGRLARYTTVHLSDIRDDVLHTACVRRPLRAIRLQALDGVTRHGYTALTLMIRVVGFRWDVILSILMGVCLFVEWFNMSYVDYVIHYFFLEANCTIIIYFCYFIGTLVL